jgi:hypothetical protein
LAYDPIPPADEVAAASRPASSLFQGLPVPESEVPEKLRRLN